MANATTFAQTFFHGTKADLKPGDLITPGFASNFAAGLNMNHVYFSATLDAAIWGAELAAGDAPGRIYIVEPTGPFEDDPNLTDKKFAGNPTKSYRSRDPVVVIGEAIHWQGHSPEQLKAMKDGLARLGEAGIQAIEN
jgi:rifampin ADP-ribosylating transferase